MQKKEASSNALLYYSFITLKRAADHFMILLACNGSTNDLTFRFLPLLPPPIACFLQKKDCKKKNIFAMFLHQTTKRQFYGYDPSTKIKTAALPWK